MNDRRKQIERNIRHKNRKLFNSMLWIRFGEQIGQKKGIFRTENHNYLVFVFEGVEAVVEALVVKLCAIAFLWWGLKCVSRPMSLSFTIILGTNYLLSVNLFIFRQFTGEYGKPVLQILFIRKYKSNSKSCLRLHAFCAEKVCN